MIGGPEALEIGLVNRTAPAGRVLEVARELAQTMARCDPAVLAHAKQSLRYGSGASLAEALANEPVVQQSLLRRKQG